MVAEQISLLSEILDQAQDIVFLGGAGVSTESGVPDFRSAQGLYNQETGDNYHPAEILSRDFFDAHTELFFEFYKGKLVKREAEPNDAHYALKKLEDLGKISLVITQNIDGLHQIAGSEKVYEIHGSMWRNYCMSCGKKYDLEYLMGSENIVPYCQKCGGIVRPDAVLYQEALDKELLQDAISKVKKADTMLVGGTALAVNPARGLVKYFRGKNLVFINLEPTVLDYKADLIIRSEIGKALGIAVAKL